MGGHLANAPAGASAIEPVGQPDIPWTSPLVAGSEYTQELPFPHDLLPAALTVSLCLTDRERVYTSATEKIQVRHDGSLRSTVVLQVALPPCPGVSTTAHGPLPVRLLPKRSRTETPSLVTVDDRPAPVFGTGETSDIVAAALFLLIAAEPHPDLQPRSTWTELTAMVRSDGAGDPGNLLQRLRNAGLGFVAAWLRILMYYRVVLVGVPSMEAGTRHVISFVTEPHDVLPTVTRTSRPSQLITSLRRTGITVLAVSPVEMDLATEKSREPLVLPPGVRCAGQAACAVTNHGQHDMPALEVLLLHDRRGLQHVVCGAGGAAFLLLVGAAVIPGVLASWTGHADAASTMLAIGPGIVVSVIMRPDLGRLLGRLLWPVQLGAAAVCASLGGAALLLLCDVSESLLRGAFVTLGTLALSTAVAFPVAERLVHRVTRTPGPPGSERATKPVDDVVAATSVPGYLPAAEPEAAERTRASSERWLGSNTACNTARPPDPAGAAPTNSAAGAGDGGVGGMRDCTEGN